MSTTAVVVHILQWRTSPRNGVLGPASTGDPQRFKENHDKIKRLHRKPKTFTNGRSNSNGGERENDENRHVHQHRAEEPAETRRTNTH